MRFLTTALLFFSLLISNHVSATINSTPVLTEAEALLHTDPRQALQVTERYLMQRRLAETSNRPHSNNEADRSIRTPLNTVHAYLISAKAHGILLHREKAWKFLALAKEIATAHHLKRALLEVTLAETSLLLTLNNDPAAAETLLQTLIAEIPKLTDMHSSRVQRLTFETTLLNAIIVTEQENEQETLAQFDIAKNALGTDANLKLKVRYQIALGNYFLRINAHERALSELLSAYWQASENDLSPQIAQANIALTKLYQQKGAFNKALQHANQAAEFYEQYDLKCGLSETQTLLAGLYHQQGRYNFALVHYFNALELEKTLARDVQIADINVAIANTYLKLLRYPQAKEYVNDAIKLAKNANAMEVLAQALIVKGEQALLTQQTDVAIDALKQALSHATAINNYKLKRDSLAQLSQAYEQKPDFPSALYFQRRYDEISQRDETQRRNQETESFKQSQRVIERQLQFDDMQKQHAENTQTIVEQKKINLFLLGSLSVLLLVLVLRNRAASMRLNQLQDLQKELYTHPRSGLRNLRMLNDRLSNSLAKTSANFEQWYLGEMIHEPLSDKLSFAMFEVPFLKVVYLQHGYHQGLELERQMGDFLKSHIIKPARLYHFSDAMFIYIEPNAETLNAPERLASKIQQLVDDFVQEAGLEDVDNRLRIGMADYPFLPRAFTSINDKELIDILLMATSAARQACKNELSSQWVQISAIDSTPAACFADNNVRQACLDGISTGLLKVKTSANGEINWQTVHESDKN
ncbi:GGDEF domain-containing protein [Enterovibrio sp. ZSDZ42]|uniref:GGDEF domain-containing protein n=1 Tax=Enterovibrio gelatinilyticus TaxID=2899819 RepID=A0ABT5R4N2_9GAMM|nr:GGDEF domain-containing protein [Enterovibrio sp. ZSDZ42]MDD1795227.1 GGDEF domain-containing protein [Enterovibrio sp. ZSDZ42]